MDGIALVLMRDGKHIGTMSMLMPGSDWRPAIEMPSKDADMNSVLSDNGARAHVFEPKDG